MCEGPCVPDSVCVFALTYMYKCSEKMMIQTLATPQYT